MSLITRTFTFTDGSTAYGSQVNSEIANIVNALNSLDQGNTTWTNVKVTTLSVQGDVVMNSHKLTGLTPGITSGDSVSFEQINGFLVPTGGVIQWTTASAPTGFILCDGSAVSRTTYSGLFSLVGTTYGAGDASTTFNVPDTRDKWIVGKGSTYTLGATGGATTHTHTANSHTHDMTHRHTTPVADTASIAVFASNATWGQGVEAVTVTDYEVVQSLSGSQSRNFMKTKINDTANSGVQSDTGMSTVSNIPPYIGLVYIIKT